MTATTMPTTFETATRTEPLDASTPADPTPRQPRWSVQGLAGLILIVGAWCLQRWVPDLAALADYLLPIGAGLLGWAAPLPAPKPSGQLGTGLAFGLMLGTSTLVLTSACTPGVITIPTVPEIEHRRDQLCALMDMLGVPQDVSDPICELRLQAWPPLDTAPRAPLQDAGGEVHDAGGPVEDAGAIPTHERDEGSPPDVPEDLQ